MSASQTILSFIAILSASGCVAAQTHDPESELLQYLRNNISNFSPLLRPTLNPNLPINITMDLTITQLVSVDSAKQSVKIGVFMQAMWTEERLVWDPSKFANISVINWDASNIWFPVILVYNGIGDNQMLTPQMPIYLRSMNSALSVVTTGWRREFEFSCQFDMTKFPIDRHECEIEFFFSDQGRGFGTIFPVKSTFMPMKITGIYRDNSEWKLLNASVKSKLKSYDLIEGVNEVKLPTYEISLVIERVSGYYFMNIITPLLLLTLLQVLVYFVPLESGEKLGFGITIMLSYTVFLLLLDNIVPKSQNSPAIATFITSAMILSTISLLLTSLIMRLHFAPEGNRMPSCLRVVLIKFLARVFCVGGSAPDTKADQVTPVDCEAKLDSDEHKGGKDDKEKPVIRSDWVVAAHAVERLMVAMGVVATAVIIGVFVIDPYT